MSSLLGSEQTQEEFNQLLQYIYQNNGVGLILSPPLLGTSSRIKMAIEHLMSNLAKPMNPILTGAGDSKNHPNPTNEWQAALLKYKTVENPRISQQSATNIQDFKPIYIDLRSLQTRSEILITIANALGMETFPKLESLQEEFYYCLRGGDLCTLFIFDHVSKIATKFLYELFASLLETIGIIIIAEFRLDLSLIWQEQQLQTAAATPVGASTPYATPNSTPGVHFFGVGNTPSASDSSTFDEAVIAKAFIKEIQDFSSLLALSFEDNVDSLTTSSSIANGNSIDAKRFLIYSSTLSFRETFAVVKSLPATQNSAQTTKEETNDANPTTSNAPPISPKTDLILDIAKGIPGLILITHSLDTKILRSLQETKGKFSRTNTILSIKQIINRYILIGRSYSTIFHVYSEIIKNLSNLLTSSALQVLKQITRLLIKSQEKKSGRFGGKGHSILRTESASDEEIDDINNNDLEEEDILIEEMESFNIPNYYSLQKENSLIYHLKLMKKDLLQLGVTENDLLILQQLQILIPLFRGGDTGNGNHHNHVTDSILKKTLSKDQEEMHENSLKSAPVFDSSSFIAGVTDDYQLFSIPVYLLEMMKFQWTSDLAQVPPSPPPSAPSATANKLLLGDPTRFLSDGIITNHLTLLLSLFQEYSILQLLFTIPELQKYQCINENMILIKYQLNKDLFYLFHQLIQCLYPYLLRITLKMDSSVTTSFTCHTVLSSLLTKKSSFVNPLFAKTRAAPTVAKDEVKPLVLDDEFLHQSHEDEERMMLMVGLIILSFGEEMLEMWYPLQENIAFITIFTKILIRWKLKDIQGLVKHPFMQNLLASTFSPNSVASNHPVDYKLAFARIVQNAISTIFQLWKTYYWSSSWISSSTKYPTGNLGGSGSFNGNDILYSSINEVVLGALEKLLAVHGNVMDVIKEVIGVPASNAVSRSKSDDSAGRANATSGLPAAAVKAVTYQYYYLLCKQMTLSTEISNITSITNLLKGARRSSQSITDIFPFILKEISNNTLSNIQSLQQSIEFFQKDYYQLSKLQMKIYLQEIIHKLINIMTTNQQQRAFSEEEIGSNTFISYSSDDWLKQRVFIIKIFESIAQTYQSSAFLLLSLVFRYFPAIVTSSSSSSATSSNATASPAVPPSTAAGAMHSLARLSSMNIACKEMMPLIYSYHTNYLCTFQDKLLFFQSLLLSLHQKHQESLFKREDIVFYSQDEEFNYHNLLANEKEIKRVMSAVMEQEEEEAKGRNHSEVDDDNDLSDLNDLNDPEKLYYTKEEQQLRQKIIQKQNILQYVLQYFTQSIEEYIAIYGNDCMLATKTIVYLSVINEIEYQFFNQNELDKILLQYYDKVLIENRNNCDLSLFHYRKLLLSSSSSSSSTLLVNNNINNNITATPQTSSSSIGKKAFPFSPRNTLSPTKSNNNIADEDTTPNNVNPSSTTVLALHYSNQNINEIKFMYSFLHYLLGKYNLFILEQDIRKSKNTKGENGETKKSKAIPKHIQETQQYITLALFQTGYETLLSIQRNEAGNALLMCLMIAQLELLGRTEKIDLFQQIMYHLVDSLNYERQYLQEKLLGMIRSLLFTKQHSNVTNPQYEDDTISVTSFGSIPVRKGFITPVGKSAAHGRTERSNPVSFIDSTIRATIRSGIELAFTLQQLLYHCAILYEERELYQQASLIYKELLYMYRDLHSLLTLDAVELFPLFSLYEYQQKEKKQQQQQQQRGGSGKKGNNPNMTNDEAEEEIAMLERLYDRMNQSIYYELLQLFEEISLSFPPIDVTIANMLFALGKSLCYYHLDPTVLGNNTMTPMNIPSGNNSNNSNNINANLYYHNLYKYYSLSHKIPTYYIMKDDRSTSHYLQYFQAIRALQTAKRLYHRIYSVNITSSLGGSGVGLSKSYSSASSDGGDDKGVSLSFLKTNSNDQMLARQYLRIYRELGRLYCSKKEFQKSRHCHQILQKLLLSVPGFLSLLEIADLQVEYGNILLHLNEFFEANIIFQQSIDYYRQYYIEQTLSNINIPPVSSNPMEGNGMHLPEGGESNDNERFTSQEEKALFQFIQKKFIISYLGKSSALLEDGDFDGAQKTIEYTIDLIYEFYQRKDDIYLIEITLAYMILASIHHYYHEYNEALELYNKIEKVYLQLHMIETVEMAKLYHNLAIVHDDMGKQKEAKVFYEKAVVLLIQRHSTQFQQLLTTLEGLHDLLMDMNLNEEAESIERYAEDLQQRIKKYDEEEELRIKTLQKSLKLQNNFLSNAEEWSYQQRRSVVKSSPVNVPNTSNTASGGRGGSPAGVPSSANSSPNLSHQFRKKYVSGRSSPGRRKSLGGGSSNGGDSAGSADEGKGGAGRGGYGPDPSAVLTKSDSFKKRLRASYYLKHKLSPSNKTLTPRSLRQVVIQTDGNPRPSIDPYYFEEEGDIEGLTYIDSPHSSSGSNPSFSRKNSAINNNTNNAPSTPMTTTAAAMSMFKQSFHFKKQETKPVAPPGAGLKSSFDIHRLFSDGVLFTSMDEADITVPGSAGGGGRRGRTESEERDDILEMGGQARHRGSGPRKHMSFGRDLNFYDEDEDEEEEEEGEYELDEEYGGEEDDDDEERTTSVTNANNNTNNNTTTAENLPSGNCIIQ